MFRLSNLIDLVEVTMFTLLVLVTIIGSPFAIVGMIDSARSDMGPVWTDSVNSGFTPDSH